MVPPWEKGKVNEEGERSGKPVGERGELPRGFLYEIFNFIINCG